MIFQDLRQFIEKVKESGDIREVSGADWDLEIGAITDISSEIAEPPLLLFDNIKDYQSGFRVVSNVFASMKRIAMSLSLPLDLSSVQIATKWKERLGKIDLIPPKTVSNGPIMENQVQDIDLFRFPVPRWHEHDAGRYIGTGSSVICKDPDSDWVNMSPYRNQVFDKRTLGCHGAPKSHLAMIREKYWKQGKSCPIAIAFGQDPTTFLASTHTLPVGMSELDYAGWVHGEPVEVVTGPLTGLPIPANAEIAIEGEIPPLDIEKHDEGPFGEYTGYYAGHHKNDPVVRVKAIYHRDEPILFGFPPTTPEIYNRYSAPFNSAHLWRTLERSGLPGIKGVWTLECSANMIIVASIKQMYPGHSRQVGHLVSAIPYAANVTRYVIVVDDDIDPSNVNQVVWALATRSDPETTIDLFRGRSCSPVDPRMTSKKRDAGEHTNTVAIIDACRPFEWIDKFPPTNTLNPELRERTLGRWGELLGIPKKELKPLFE